MYLKMKVLIVEDDTGLNRGLEFALSQDGYEVVTADSGRHTPRPRKSILPFI